MPSVSDNGPLIIPFVGLSGLPSDHKGLTMLELMVVLTIAAILFGLAIPGMRDFVLNSRMVTHTNDLMGDLNFARSEAIKRSADITVCKLVANAATPTCNTGGDNWAGGWAVFIDTDSGGDIDAGEQVLRFREPLAGSSTTLVAAGTLANKAVYTRSGLSTLGASAQWTLCDGRTGALIGRSITLETTGRVAVQKISC